MTHSLKELKKIISIILQQLNWEKSPLHNNPSAVKLSNADKLREAVYSIKELGFFPNEVAQLESSQLFSITGTDIRIDVNLANLIESNLKYLQLVFDKLYSILETILPEDDPDSVNIKLPPIGSFEDLAQAAKNLHLALTQVLYLDEINGNAEIISVENGSIWVNVLIRGQLAVALVASLAWSSAVVYKKIEEGRLIEEKVSALKIQNNTLEDIRQAQKKELALLVEAEAQHIHSEFFKNNAPEEIERIKNSLNIFSELIAKGAKIEPALTAPENVSNLFPDFKKLPTIESKIKQITQGEGN